MARLRHHLASLACIAGIATTARAQDELWHAIGSLGFGSESTLAGDFNGDGCRDVLVGQPDWYYSWLPGQVFGLDGRTGAELFRIQDPSTAFGEHVATLGDDVNGDGVDDFLASSVSSSSTLLFSGADQTVLRNVYGIGQLQSLPDLDGDGIRDFVSASAYPGGVTVYSSASGAVLRSFLRSTIPSIAVLDDVDLDGWPDLALGDGDAGGTIGAVTIYSLKSGVQLKVLTGTKIGEHFGTTVVSLHDLDADGATDFAVGAFPFATAQPDPYVAIYSGRTYSLLRTLTTDAHGHTVGLFSGAGDVDGDGVFDFFIGSNGEDAQHDGFPAFAISGRTFAPIFNAASLDLLHRGGDYVVPVEAADLDGDGFGEVIVSDYRFQVAVLRGGPRFLSARHPRIHLDPPARSDRSLPGGGSSSPNVGSSSKYVTELVASGFAPNTLLTFALVKWDGRPLFQNVLTVTTDADGTWSGDYPRALFTDHIFELQAIGIDATGAVVSTPPEAIEYLHY